MKKRSLFPSTCLKLFPLLLYFALAPAAQDATQSAWPWRQSPARGQDSAHQAAQQRTLRPQGRSILAGKGLGLGTGHWAYKVELYQQAKGLGC